MLVYCGQLTVGRIKVKLGVRVGLGPGHIVLDGHPAPLSTDTPDFGPICCGQMAGWIKIPLSKEVGLGLSDIVQDAELGPSSPPQKVDRAPQFSAHIYCGQTAGRIKMPLGMVVGLGPCCIVIDGDPKKGHSPPIFVHVYVMAKRLYGSRCHLVRTYSHIVLHMGYPAQVIYIAQ